MQYFIAVDVGGTQLRAACYPENSHTPEKIQKISTRSEDATVTERLIKLIERVMPDQGLLAAIGLAIPGAVNPFDGIVYIAPNIPGWVNVPVKEIVQEHFNIPVAVGNDANLAALGEWKYGAGRGHSNLLYFTISTGVGGGVILDNRLLLGQSGLAGEVGHITVAPEGPLCGCGKRGHLEAIVSGPAIARWAAEQIAAGVPSSLSSKSPITAKDVAAAAANGDTLANDALKRAGFWFGRALADFLHLFNPSAVIIGGGVSQSGEILFTSIRASLEQHAISPKYYQDLVIRTAQFGDDAGLIGALSLAQDAVNP